MLKGCLAIMPFSPAYREVFDYAIKPACEKAGFRCLRADYPLKAGNIIEHTIDLIFETDVVIADISLAKPNVFYELGIAHALEKQVVMICEKGTELPFNITTYRVVFYRLGIEGVQTVLKSTLENILGDVETWASVRATNPVQVIRLLRHLEQRREELEDHVRRLEEEKRRQPELLEFILPDIELEHLRYLEGSGEFRYKKQQTFLEELRHLRWAGLIKNSTKIADIPDAGDLKQFVHITEKGKRLLAYQEVRAAHA
jgi:hypothetical protein